jgi:hypothetical protein
MNFETSAVYLKNLKRHYVTRVVTHVAMPLLIIVFTYSTNLTITTNPLFHQIMKWVMPIVLVACFLGAAYLFKQKIDAILAQPSLTLLQKLHKYREASIVRWSVIEIPIALSSVLYFFTENYFYLVIAFIAFILVNMYAPSKAQVIINLHLNDKEQDTLNDEYAVL